MLIDSVLIRKLRAPVYKSGLWVVVSDNLSKSIDVVEDIVDHRIIPKSDRASTKAYTYAYEDHEGKYKILIFVKQNAKPGVVAHEASHAVKILLHWHGMKPSYTNDEHEAYLLEWVVDQIHTTMKIYDNTSN